MIHVLGAGNIGSLFAASLSRKLPVQLILKSSSLRKYVEDSAETIRIRSPFPHGAEWEHKIPAVVGEEVKHIKHLLVCVKAFDVQKALASVQHAISPHTEILVVHNGMGVREQLHKFWPSERTRPRLGFGVTDAGMRRMYPQWTFNYTGRGTCQFAFEYPGTELGNMLMRSRELLVSDEVPLDVFEARQKMKLAINAVINPLTAILECPNGALSKLDGWPEHSMIVRRVANEVARVLGLDRSDVLSNVMDVVERTSTNISSMLSDVEKGRSTEIDYINGYILQEAKRQGMPALHNEMLTQLVKMKVQQVRHEDQISVPLEKD